MTDDTLKLDAGRITAFGRVGVLYGGLSSERDVSLQSGAAVIEALNSLGLNVVAIDLQDNPVETLVRENLDRVFIALHGPGGEDGTLQGALEMLDIPYTGSGVLASALAMDKARTKQLWRGAALPTAAHWLLDENTDWEAALSQLGGKAMVKPACEGSSIGMAIADSPASLKSAWQSASRYDDDVIAESWLSGEEYTVAIVDGEVLPPIKLETDRVFYDYEAKYLADDTRYLCPCGLDQDRESELKQLALTAFESVGCSGWGRVDVMTDESGAFQLLEVNTVPGMTSHSLVPMAAKTAGWSFPELVLRILESAGAVHSGGES